MMIAHAATAARAAARQQQYTSVLRLGNAKPQKGRQVAYNLCIIFNLELRHPGGNHTCP